MNERGNGILLHITSLPAAFGIGDLGPEAYRFADFLAATKQRYWQILPLNPTDPICDSSPYHSISAFANSPLLISPEILVQDGMITESEIEGSPVFPVGQVDYPAAESYKMRLLHRAFSRFNSGNNFDDYENFCRENAHWLDNFAVFRALKEHYNGNMWCDWPADARNRQPESIQSLSSGLHEKIEFEKYLQYIFMRQWLQLKQYCNQKGISILGDIPIYVVYDGADVWANPEIFKLDDEKRPLGVAGVPPDYFSKTGQLWGNPIYDWEALRRTGYEWWIQRVGHALKLFDVVRIDHFRGLVAYWEVPAGEKTAVKGRWVKAPVIEFFTLLKEKECAIMTYLKIIYT